LGIADLGHDAADPCGGDMVPVVVDRLTGKTRPAQIFVAVLGASNFTYAEASWTQALADWIGAHSRAFEAIGRVPNLRCRTTPGSR
jgi:transposase